MSFTLTSTHLAQLETASRALLSPLAAPSPEQWITDAGSLVRDLVGGAGVVVRLPTTAQPYVSYDLPDVAADVRSYVQGVQMDGIRFSDPVVDLWHRLRRQSGVNVWSWDVNRHMVEAQGLDYFSSPIVTEVLQHRGIHDFVGMMSTASTDESMIWVLGTRAESFARDQNRAARLLGVLMPSYQAGLYALTHLYRQRAALDAVAEPVAVFDADGRELHRNPALSALLSADPEQQRLAFELRIFARTLCPLGFPRPGGAAVSPMAEAHSVTTPRGTYRMRGSLLPPGTFADDGALLVSVHLDAAPAFPAVDALREAFGLTRREAEVALLVAEGLPNKEIADRLFVSPHTVRHHVENVLGKLGVPSRAAVAASLYRS